MGQIRFILGRSGTGKTTRCVEAAADALRAGGDAPLVLLTPEQATYQMERAVLAQPGVAGFSRLRVLSFNRLVFWLSRRLRTGAELSRLGRQMAAYRILLEQAERLSLYRTAARHAGLAERISGLLTELQQADCSPEQVAALAEQLERENPGGTTTRKWRDIAIIYSEYAAFFKTSEALRNPDAELTLARRDIAASPFIKEAQIWVDGFSGFTVQEREMLVDIARHCKTMHIALCLDPAKLDLDNTDPETLDPADLFYTTEQTYAELLGIFRKCRFDILAPRILSRPARYADAPALESIESALATDTSEPASANGAVEVVCCPDVRGEAEWTARRICELVRHQGYRYRQIAVAVPDMDTYGVYLESAFARCGIPCFLDRPAAVRHHPLAETLQAALAAAEQFATTDILCYLKSGLTGVADEQIDRLERYCLKYGIEREDWTAPMPWRFAAADEPAEDAAAEPLRQMVTAALSALHESLYAEDKPLEASAFVRAVWDFLERIEARKRLATWAQDDPTDAQGHRQTWTQLTAVLDEMERVFGGHPEPTAVFVSTLADALSSLTIKLIPPTLDQVLVGSIERSRHPDIRAMFLVGAAQHQFPTPLSTTDLLGRGERQAAQSGGLELTDPLTQQLSKRHYLAYIALTRASEYIAVSYPQQDEKGAPVVPSTWVERLSRLFTDVRPRAMHSNMKILESQSVAELAERLAAACGKDRPPQGPTDGAAFALHAALRSSCESIRAAAEHVMGALTYTNAAALTSESALRQFKHISAFSASRLETFAACPYQHFAAYILELEKRPLLRFEPVDVGSFYHTVIETLFGRLQQRGWTWASAPTEALATLCDQIIQETIEQSPTMTAFMRRQMHHRYVIECACETVRQFVAALAELERAGALRQTAAELSFQFPLDSTVRIKGRIDRVDVAEIDGQRIAAIFDFKRTPRSIAWARLFYGLDIQLLTYLPAVPYLPEHIRADVIAGAFYLPFEYNAVTRTPDMIETQRHTFPYKARGIFNGAYAETLDKTARQWSRFYNFYVANDGSPYSFYGSSGAVRPDEFDALLSWAKRLMARQIERIRSGVIAAKPYRLNKDTPCRWCDYKSLCRFDWQINDYNTLTPVDKQAVITLIQEDVQRPLNDSAGTHRAAQ